jgi:hypothetical protein
VSLVGHVNAALLTGDVVGLVVGDTVGALVATFAGGVTPDEPLPPPPHEASAMTRTNATNRTGSDVMTATLARLSWLSLGYVFDLR